MARKRSDIPVSETTTLSSPQTNTTVVAPETTTPKTKTEAVHRALAAGIMMPKAIATFVKDTFGIDVSPAHISVIKGAMKIAKKAKGKPGPNPKQHQTAAQVTQPVKKAAPAQGAGLTHEDLASLAEIAERAGGIEKLEAFLSVLKRLR